MRDQRADALAQILVRYSTRVQPDDVCVIQSTTEAEPLVQAIYEEVLRAGGLPIMQLSTEGAAPAFYELANEKQLEWIPPTATWAAENADVRIAVMADANPRALSQVDPKRQAIAPEGAQAAHGDEHEARRRGELPLVADAVPDARLRVRGRHVARRLRGLLLQGLPRHRRRAPHRLAAPVRRGQAAGRVDGGQGGGPHHGAGHRHHARRRRAQVHPVRGRAQHARRRVLHRPDRGLGERRDRVLVPGHLRRARGRGRPLHSSRTARWSTPRPSAARTS